MRVPFIAAWAKPNPEIPSQQRLPIAVGTIQTQVADVTDIFPTLVRLVAPEANGAAPGNHIMDGLPLDTLLSGRPDPSHRGQLLMHYPHAVHRSNYFTVWRDGDWKVIYHSLPEVPTHGCSIQSEGGHYELFNLKDDPFEQTNLAESEKETLTRMMRAMVGQLEEKGAVYPLSAEGEALIPIVP